MAISFAARTKEELCRHSTGKDCCEKAETYGFFLFGKNFSSRNICVTTESAFAARRAAQQIAETAGVIAETTAGVRRRDAGLQAVTVSVSSREECSRVLSFFGHDGDAVTLHIQRSNLDGECCFAAFLRGAFLSCGTVTQPEKEYHLEFSVSYKNLAGDLALLLKETDLEIKPGVASRRGSYVVYVNGAEEVGDLLTYMGASGAALELIQAKMVKEVRNNVNRKMNFESANQDKTADAAARQVLAIRRIAENGGLAALPEELQELARIRLEFPECSLRELGSRLSSPISRSGVNHRLKKLLQIAEGLGKDNS